MPVILKCRKRLRLKVLDIMTYLAPTMAIKTSLLHFLKMLLKTESVIKSYLKRNKQERIDYFAVQVCNMKVSIKTKPIMKVQSILRRMISLML